MRNKNKNLWNWSDIKFITIKSRGQQKTISVEDFAEGETHRWHCTGIVENYDKYVRQYHDHTWDEMEWSPSFSVAFDELGLIIPKDVLEWIVETFKPEERGYSWRTLRNGYKNNWHHGCYHRLNSFIGAHRDLKMVETDDDCLEHHIRYRHKSLPPDSWNDKVRSDFGIKNWKNFRKTQYK